MSEFIFKGNVVASCDEWLNNKSVKNLWHSFCFTQSILTFETGADFTFKIGNAPMPTLESDKEYALTVSPKGISIIGRDYGGLMRGFLSMLMKIELDNGYLKIKSVSQQSNYRLQNRMIHICVFPENDLYFIKKLIRLAALCQYTHIVIEFWGMLQYDCLRELAWPQAFTKEQARELITECRELGVEPIPMFNQLGHASAARSCYGKHVVLDQNPTLQPLFTPDGWAWDIDSDEVFDLLKQVRGELYDLFGDGEYMHIGCDEAHYISRTPELRAKLPEYLHRLTQEVAKEGRRPMLWMDMLIEKGKFKDCYAACNPEDVQKLMSSLSDKSVLVDWQYGVKSAPVESLVHLKDSGFDAIGAPWFDPNNYKAHIDTVADNNFYGVMLTTWHTIKDNMPRILGCAKQLGASTFAWSQNSGDEEEVATMLRRLSFEGNTYADCGWAKEQIEV